MLDRFDWLRLSRTGSELLATLELFTDDPTFPAAVGEPGPPHSALQSPCERCWVYPRSTRKLWARFCPTCEDVLSRSWRLGEVSRGAIAIWGRVDPLPQSLRTDTREGRLLGAYVHDPHHFLAMLARQDLKAWLQDIVLDHGAQLRGLLQIFLTVGKMDPTMGELLCRLAHGERRFAMTRLQVRFFSQVARIFRPQRYDREGVLTFDIADFLSILEMATVFHAILDPDEQQMLYALLRIEDPARERFYWGRLLGHLHQEARDLVNAWNLRQWSRPQVQLLYDLMRYVALDSSG